MLSSGGDAEPLEISYTVGEKAKWCIHFEKLWQFHNVKHTPIIPPRYPIPGCVSERKVSVQGVIHECS